MPSQRRSAIIPLILTLTALIALCFGVSTLLLESVQLRGTGVSLVVVGTAFVTALVIGLCTEVGRAVFDGDHEFASTLSVLGNLDHPLLARLQREAPGTYHHSVAVASLAEAAARAIGADAQLVRIGSYYHDIGKLQAPELFIENIDPKDDPHHQMEPIDSARIIIHHVIDGIRIAREGGLPEEVANFIPEHTGTTLVYFFYSKAKHTAKKGETVHKRDFRYPGPKPMSKETALVMLADTVEAAVRAHATETDAQLQAVIEEVTQEKMNDTQLDISGMTDNDVALARNAFFTVLRRLHHKRVKYPKRNAIRSSDDE